MECNTWINVLILTFILVVNHVHTSLYIVLDDPDLIKCGTIEMYMDFDYVVNLVRVSGKPESGLSVYYIYINIYIYIYIYIYIISPTICTGHSIWVSSRIIANSGSSVVQTESVYRKGSY